MIIVWVINIWCASSCMRNLPTKFVLLYICCCCYYYYFSLFDCFVFNKWKTVSKFQCSTVFMIFINLLIISMNFIESSMFHTMSFHSNSICWNIKSIFFMIFYFVCFDQNKTIYWHIIQIHALFHKTINQIFKSKLFIQFLGCWFNRSTHTFGNRMCQFVIKIVYSFFPLRISSTFWI